MFGLAAVGTREVAAMLNRWSDRVPEPPPPDGYWAVEYIFLAVVVVLGALFVASIIAGLIVG